VQRSGEGEANNETEEEETKDRRKKKRRTKLRHRVDGEQNHRMKKQRMMIQPVSHLAEQMEGAMMKAVLD
jgi:hypothetical protein